MAIRVLMVVREPIASIGLRAILDGAQGIRCTPPSPDDTRNVRAAVARERPDVVFLDVALRREDPRLIPDIVDQHPGTRVLVYVDHSPQECAVRHLLELKGKPHLSPDALARLDDCCLTSLRQRAHGCLGTGVPADAVVKTVRAVATGEIAAAPWLAALAETVQLSTGRESSPISARELEVMTLLAEGLSNKQIAKRLGIREQTVKNHVTRTMEKLGVQNRTEVGLLAARYRMRLVQGGDAPKG